MRFGIREKLLVLILLAVPIASWWLVFRPQNREIEQAKSEISVKKALLDQLQKETNRNEDLERANEEMRVAVDAIEARLPNQKEVDSVVRDVSTLALEAGLEAPAMKSEKPVEAARYMEQPLALRMKGQFEGFYDFLLKLEKLPRITRIPDLKIVRQDDSDGHMKAEFTLSIYFQDEPAGAGSTGGKP